MKETKARRSVGVISNSSDLVSGWVMGRNESAQNKGDDNHEKRSRETIEQTHRGKGVKRQDWGERQVVLM